MDDTVFVSVSLLESSVQDQEVLVRFDTIIIPRVCFFPLIKEGKKSVSLDCLVRFLRIKALLLRHLLS